MARHSSRIYLSQSALKNNINFIRKKVGAQVRISSVVKANAYGHGIQVFVKMLEKAGIDHISVASAFEAEEVMEVCDPSTSIMIMGILYDEDLGWAIEEGIEFFVFDFQRLKTVNNVAKSIGKKALVHLELETGTNRTGINPQDVPKIITYMKRNADWIEFVGLCTHLGGAESMANEFKIKPQIKRFDTFYKEFKRKKLLPRYRHIASSAATLAYPETHLDLVRVGVTTYGFWPSPELYYVHLQESGKQKDSPLKRIITWKTDIMDIKNVKEGEFVGYGTAFQALQNMRVAVLPLGYSNGYPRALSNTGHVLIHGKRAPIVGLINMNLFTVDISHIPEAKIGDEVVLLGKQKNKVIKVSSFTNRTHLLNNEMLSRLPTSIPRTVVR
jgi:alanine racemase